MGQAIIKSHKFYHEMTKKDIVTIKSLENIAKKYLASRREARQKLISKRPSNFKS